MRILYFGSDFNKRPETFVLREIKELRRQGVDVVLVDVRPFASSNELIESLPCVFPHSSLLSLIVNSLKRCLQGRSVWTIRSDFWKSAQSLTQNKGLLKYLMSGLVSDSLITKLREDSENIHIHAHHLFLTTFVASNVAKALNRHFSLTLHTCSNIFAVSELKDILNRAAFIRTVTSELKPYYNKYIANDSKFHLITNGINPDEFSFSPFKSSDGKIRIVSIGSLYDKKGFDLGIEACRILEKSSLSFSYTIMGDGPERAYLEKLIRIYGLKDHITLAGNLGQEDVKAHLERSDVLLVPSREPKRSTRDGLPTVIIEAMSLGIPVVASDFAGIRDIVEQGETGVLVQQEDYKTMASAIVKLWFNDKLRERIVHRARTEIQSRYNIMTNITDIIALHQ